MRERWCLSADDIMERQLRPVEFNDLVAFMDWKARIATNFVFGNMSSSIQEKENRRSRQLVLDHLNPRQRPLLAKLKLISL